MSKPEIWYLTSAISKISSQKLPVTVARGRVPKEHERIEVIEKQAYDKAIYYLWWIYNHNIEDTNNLAFDALKELGELNEKG